MSQKIMPFAYELAPEFSSQIYYLGFPKKWKDKLVEIVRTDSPSLKEDYYLPVTSLRKMLESWMTDVVSVAPLKIGSEDKYWLSSCKPYTQYDLKNLCEMIKTWVKSTFILCKKPKDEVVRLARLFCEMIIPEDFLPFLQQKEVKLVTGDSQAQAETYAAIPLIMINQLLGKDLVIKGKRVHLCYVSRNQLISDPIIDEQTKQAYSFVFQLSVQTIPPKRKAWLLCHISIRRWISQRDGEKLYIPDSVNAHIRIDRNKFCQIPMEYHNKKWQWVHPDIDCYQIWGYDALPEAEKVLDVPGLYAKQILLPFRYGMSGIVESEIGTGVPVVDKVAFYREIKQLLGDMVTGETLQASRLSTRGSKAKVYSSPEGYESRESFRSWVKKCAQTDHITFEIYGMTKNDEQSKLMARLEEKLKQDLGSKEILSGLRITYKYKDIGDLANPLLKKKDQQRPRYLEIEDWLEQAEGVTGSIVLLPGPNHYRIGEDPKQDIRCGFALSGRVVQFITPEKRKEEVINAKINNTIYDLYRQLGIILLLDESKKLPKLADTACAGLYVQSLKIGKKQYLLPLFVLTELTRGNIKVYCEAFSEKPISYREACLEMAKLSLDKDVQSKVKNAATDAFRRKLIELRNLYDEPEHGILLFIHSDAITRKLCLGISDTSISQYVFDGNYCPQFIEAGTYENSFKLSMNNCGVRIVRIRTNQEVPDYYTSESSESSEEEPVFVGSSGIFKYQDVYYSVLEHPFDAQYYQSYKLSRMDFPLYRFAEKDMVELFPLQMQQGDDPDQWIAYTNALRYLSVQYNQATILPLPLHLAKGLEEYWYM